MTLRHLKIFVAVCEHGSTTKASKALYIVQPTISHSILELEEYYNVKLFDRINQRLVLTDIGKDLLVKAKEILSGFEDFESLATFHEQTSIVKIGAALTLGQTLIPRYLQLVEKNNLSIQPQVIVRPSTALELELEQGNLDFAVIGGDVLSPYLNTIPLSSDRFVAVALADYDIPKTLTFEELVKYPLLLRERGSSSRDFIDKIAIEKGLQIRTKMDSSNNQALIAAVYSSLGVSFLPESYAGGHIARGKFKEIKIKDISSTRTNYLVIHKNKKLNQLQQQAFDLIKTMI